MEKCNFCCGFKKPEEIAWISRGKNTLLVKCKDCFKEGKFIPNIPEGIKNVGHTEHCCKPSVDSGNDRGSADSDSGFDAGVDKNLDYDIQQEG